MDLKQIKNLLTLIAESGVNEVYIEEGDFKIKVKKLSDSVQHVVQPTYQQSIPTIDLSQPAPTAVPREAPAIETPAPSPKSSGITIKSPIVGTYYSSPSPDAKPFLSVGDTIAKGDPLCIIEAMKIMNEIESEHSGVITKMLVKNGQPVEYDQPLFEIDPA